MVFRLLLILTFLSMPFPGLAAEVAGVKLPDEDQKLVLNGAGLRKRAFFNVYVIGLYLPEKKAATADVLALAGRKRVLIHMLRDVDAAQFSDALQSGMVDNLSEEEMKSTTAHMRDLAARMDTVKVARSGMRILLEWNPDSGTLLWVDGKALGAPMPGVDFYRALLKIWLGEKPVQADLKKALLGEKQ